MRRMQIELLSIVSACLFLLLGLWLGFLVGRKVGQLRLFSTAMRVKNPEMWELLHFYVVDQTPTEKVRRRQI